MLPSKVASLILEQSQEEKGQSRPVQEKAGDLELTQNFQLIGVDK